MIRLLVLFVFIFMLSCGIKTKFDRTDLIWLNPYNKGDIIVYESDKSIYDTIYIMDKKNYYDVYNPVEVHDKYHPHVGIIYYKSKRTNFHLQPNGDILIEMYKWEPNLPADFVFEFLNGWIGVQNYLKIPQTKITLSNRLASN